MRFLAAGLGPSKERGRNDTLGSSGHHHRYGIGACFEMFPPPLRLQTAKTLYKLEDQQYGLYFFLEPASGCCPPPMRYAEG
jgi:hypothetical protein